MKKRMKYVIFFLISFIILIYLFNDRVNKNAYIIITDKNDKNIAVITNSNKASLTKVDDISKDNLDLLLYIEDKDFYNHKGINYKRLFYQIFLNIFNNETKGASTITSQAIKNIYLHNKKTLRRKLTELKLAYLLEQNSTKEQILSKYLTSSYFGNNIYGFKDAAKFYFNKDLKDINKSEMIYLIAIINAPSLYIKDNYSLINKVKLYKDILYKAKLIDSFEYNNCDNIKLLNNINYISHQRLYYVDEVLTELNKTNINSGFNEDIYIKTYYDSKYEKVNFSNKCNSSILIVNKLGYISFLSGDSLYYYSNYNMIYSGKRDIASTIKPLLYYEAIKCHKDNNKYLSKPLSINYNDEIITITNSNNYYPKYPLSMKEALAISDNIYAVKMHMALGLNTLVNHLKRYGIESLPLISLGLGSVGMSLYELVCIYMQFFTSGLYYKPVIISKIVCNNEIINVIPKCYKVNDVKIIKMVRELLKYPLNSKIKNSTLGMLNSRVREKCYGKTGTTIYDSYVLGFDEDCLIGIWCGNKDNSILADEYKKLPKDYFESLILL